MGDFLEKIKSRMPERVKHFFGFMHAVFTDYAEDNGALVAAAVSFYVSLAMIPILLLAIAIVGWVLGSPARAESLILSGITANAPELTSQTEVMDMLRGVVTQIITGRGAATGFGLLGLLWLGTSVVSNFEKAINLMWGVEQRTFLKQRLLALGVLAMMGGLMGLSLGITTLFNAVKALDIPIPLINEQGMSWIWQFLGYLVPVALMVLTFTLFYKIIPNLSVPWKTALVAGLFAGIMLYIAQLLFAYYVTNFSNYSAVYGSLAGIFILMIWINYSAIITMLGAEVGAVHAGRRDPQ